MAIRNTKTEAAYKAEFNALLQGATVAAERMVQVRKNLSSLGKRGNSYATGPVARSVGSIFTSLKAVKSFKGEGERNIGKR